MRRNHVFNFFQKIMIYCIVFVLNQCVYESLISMNFLVKNKLTFTLIQLNFNQPVPNTSEAYFLCKNASCKIQHQFLLTSFFGGYLPVVVALPVTLRAIAAILLLRLSSITPSLLRVTALWSLYAAYVHWKAPGPPTPFLTGIQKGLVLPHLPLATVLTSFLSCDMCEFK